MPRLGIEPGQSLEVHLHGFQMDDIEQGNVGNQRRQGRSLDDLGIGDAHILHHQEGGRAHDRRRQLAVD